MTETRDTEIAQYRALSALAVVALILGLASPLAMVDPLLWTVPWAGVAFSAAALWRIAQARGGLVGRKAALTGLTLSVLFAAAAPTNWLVYRRLVRDEAQQFARYWLDFLADGRPHMAHQLTWQPEDRRPLDDELREYYRRNENVQNELDLYVSKPPVSLLLGLGPKAGFRYVKTSGQTHTGQRDIVYDVYAVTPDGAKGNEAIFVGLMLQRVKLKTGWANWYLVDAYQESRPTEER